MFYPKHAFWLKILVVCVISCLKNRLFFEKQKIFFVFSRFSIFLILWPEFSVQAHSIYFSFVGKRMWRCRALQSPFFKLSFIFIMYTDTYVTRDPFLAWFLSHWTCDSLFPLKKLEFKKKALWCPASWHTLEEQKN